MVPVILHCLSKNCKTSLWGVDGLKLLQLPGTVVQLKMAILTIHSHVSCGHVGNSAAVYPLQRLGHEVWPVHTVLLSHHPGHGRWHGSKLKASNVETVLDGLDEHGILSRCDAVLTGYLSSSDIGEVVLKGWQKVRNANSKSLIACDPILGDKIEGLYVTKNLVQFYLKKAIPQADLIFPNQFELELLTGMEVKNPPGAVKAARYLISKGPKIVVATSIPAGQKLATVLVTPNSAWQIKTPRLELIAKGAGDVFAALYLGNFLAQDIAPEEALSAAVNTTYRILKNTETDNLPELALLSIQIPSGRSKPAYSASLL